MTMEFVFERFLPEYRVGFCLVQIELDSHNIKLYHTPAYKEQKTSNDLSEMTTDAKHFSDIPLILLLALISQ